MIEDTIRELKEKGYRVTSTRKAVLEIFVDTAKPISAEGLIRNLASKKLYPNKTTIYRELDTLRAGGFIKEVQLGLNRRVYEVTSLGHHHHLVCTKCDCIEDIHIKNDMMAYEKNIMKKTLFKVFDHSLEFFGLCVKCQ